jgi:hypothetical protein
MGYDSQSVEIERTVPKALKTIQHISFYIYDDAADFYF